MTPQDSIRDIISGIVANLISEGQSIDLHVSGGPASITVLLTVEKDQISKIIGKQGRNINSLKVLCAAVAAKSGYRFNLIVEE